MSDPTRAHKQSPASGDKDHKAPAADNTLEPPAKDSGVDFAELDEAYRNASIAQNEVMNRRANGIREVLGNLTEADSPSLTDELLKTLAIAALGLASGYVTAAITGKLVAESAVVLANAVQTALDDGLKDAATKVAGALAAVDGQSKATFFASQEDGLEPLRTAALKAISAEWKHSTHAVQNAAVDKKSEVFAAQVKGARTFDKAATESAEAARQLQYQQSLAKWMNAMSQGALGGGNDGTQLGKAVDMTPKDHYAQQGAKGVIYVAFASHPASRPFAVSGKRATIKVAGMTSAARERIKNTPIKDLGMPIVASGYIYDGFLDGISVSAGDNEIAFGINEGRTVWVRGHDDALNGLKKAANMANAVDAARVILDEDIGVSTLEHAAV